MEDMQKKLEEVREDIALTIEFFDMIHDTCDRESRQIATTPKILAGKDRSCGSEGRKYAFRSHLSLVTCRMSHVSLSHSCVDTSYRRLLLFVIAVVGCLRWSRLELQLLMMPTLNSSMVRLRGGKGSNRKYQIWKYAGFASLFILWFYLHDIDDQLGVASDHKTHNNNHKLAKQHPYQPSSLQECRPLRDVSHYSTSTVRYPMKDESYGRQNSKYDSCLEFKCDWNATTNTHCDSFGPTIYNDPTKPPCCVHILRDMAAAFDSVMCKLGFEYFSSYGMLLGLVRNDKLIPWTSDNDYIATERTLAAMYDMSTEDKKVWEDHGLAFFFDNYYHRVCVTDKFMNGELAKLWTTSSYEWYPLVYPYADIFIAKELSSSDGSNTNGIIKDQLGCEHSMDSFRPARRRGVYQDSFQVSIPNDAEKALERVYGSTWRIPDKEKRPHGDTKCKR